MQPGICRPRGNPHSRGLLCPPPQVRLLLGEVPDRTELTAPDIAVPLGPYFDVAAAVRSGDLAAFRSGPAAWPRGCCHQGLGQVPLMFARQQVS